MADTAPNPHERRAQALAEVTQMQADLVAAHKRIEEMESGHAAEYRDLEYQLSIWKDRCALNEEERTKYRGEAMLYRGKLIELATQMADIGLLTRRAEKVMEAVHCLLGDDPAHAQEEQESARELVKSLPQAPQQRSRCGLVTCAW